jgi:DHA1 family multidrug resistance protein-like MFS transporter
MAPSAASPISWKRNLAVVWFTELVAIAGFSVMSPILPLYVRELGVRDPRAVTLWAGAVFSAPAVTMAVVSPIWGALSDRYGRKMMVERAMFSGAVLIALAGLVRSVEQLVVLRAIQGALTGTISAATTLVAATTPRDRAGYAQGLLQMAVYVGASVGPLLGGVIADEMGYRATFWATGLLLLVAGLGVLFLVREDFQPPPPRPRSVVRLPLRQRIWAALAPVLGSTLILGQLALGLVARTGPRLLAAMMPLFVESIAAGQGRVASLSGLVSGVSAAAGALGAVVLGRLGDRVGYRGIMIGCALTSVGAYAAMAAVGSPAALLAWQGLTGLAMGGILASLSAALAVLAPVGQEGVIYGVNASLTSVANAAGPLMGSTLAVWLGLRAPFVGSAAFFALSALAAVRLMPSRPAAGGPCRHGSAKQEVDANG